MQESTKKVRRKHAIVLAIILTLGLVVLLTDQGNRAVWKVALLLALQIAGSFWVLDLNWKFERKNLDIYALLVLPTILYAGFMLFLSPIRAENIVWFGIVANFPLMYLLYISLSALQQYRILPNHVARVILNVLSLLAGYIAFVFIFQAQLGVGVGMLLVFFISELIFYQGIFWWSNNNFEYSLFYSTLASFVLSIMYFVLYFWPFGYLVTGFSLMVGQYVLMGIIQQYFKKQLSLYLALENIAIGMICLAYVLLQVRWIPQL